MDEADKIDMTHAEFRKRMDEARFEARIHGAMGALITAAVGYFLIWGGLGDEIVDALADYIPKWSAMVLVIAAAVIIIYRMWMGMVIDPDRGERKRLERIIARINKRK